VTSMSLLTDAPWISTRGGLISPVVNPRGAQRQHDRIHVARAPLPLLDPDRSKLPSPVEPLGPARARHCDVSACRAYSDDGFGEQPFRSDVACWRGYVWRRS
jgi:hypothetical protein